MELARTRAALSLTECFICVPVEDAVLDVDVILLLYRATRTHTMLVRTVTFPLSFKMSPLYLIGGSKARQC